MNRADFWSKVAERSSGCREWTAARTRQGYGKARMEGRFILAHRVAWELSHGPIPAGLLVCHRCDNPPCCNPEHLFLGTGQENMDDMVRKGRSTATAAAARALPAARVWASAIVPARRRWRFKVALPSGDLRWFSYATKEEAEKRREHVLSLPRLLPRCQGEAAAGPGRTRAQRREKAE